MSTKDFRTRNEIVVTVKGKARAEIENDRGSRKGKGSAPPVKKDKRFLHRRTKETVVNFWDLGQIKSGDVYIDLPFYFNPGYNYYPDFPAIPSGNQAVDFDDIKALETLVFAYPVSQWKDKYRKFTYELAERYGLDFAVGDDTYLVGREGSRNLVGGSSPSTANKWTAQGLKTKNLDSGFTIIGPKAFSYFDTTNTSAVKITAVQNYAAAEVPLSLKGEVDIFLMPSVYLGTGGSAKNLGGSPALLQFDVPFFNCDILPRSWFLSDGVFAGGLALQYQMFGSLYPSVATAADIQALLAVYKSRPAATAIGLLVKLFGYAVTPHPDPPPPSTGALSEFPSGSFFNIVLNPQLFFAGTLFAVIQSGGNTFYVWCNADSSLATPIIGNGVPV